MTLPVVYAGVSSMISLAHSIGTSYKRPQLGEEFLAAVQATLRAVEQYPDMFTAIHGEVRRAVVSRFPFAVFYTVEARRIVVLRVLHTARNPVLWPALRRPAR